MKAIYALYMYVHTNDVVISQSNSIASAHGDGDAQKSGSPIPFQHKL